MNSEERMAWAVVFVTDMNSKQAAPGEIFTAQDKKKHFECFESRSPPSRQQAQETKFQTHDTNKDLIFLKTCNALDEEETIKAGLERRKRKCSWQKTMSLIRSGLPRVYSACIALKTKKTTETHSEEWQQETKEL